MGFRDGRRLADFPHAHGREVPAEKIHGKATQALPFFILPYTDEAGSWPQRVENVKQNQQSQE